MSSPSFVNIIPHHGSASPPINLSNSVPSYPYMPSVTPNPPVAWAKAALHQSANYSSASSYNLPASSYTASSYAAASYAASPSGSSLSYAGQLPSPPHIGASAP